MQDQFSAGAEYDFGTVIFSEEDIIDFALLNDPLDFHTNRDIAKDHIFGDLVASGQHAFNYFYVKEWIPRFGKTVLCGLGVENWKFQSPIYANQVVRCRLSISNVISHAGRNSCTVYWRFEFLNSENTHFQQLDMSVLHRQSASPLPL